MKQGVFRCLGWRRLSLLPRQPGKIRLSVFCLTNCLRGLRQDRIGGAAIERAFLAAARRRSRTLLRVAPPAAWMAMMRQAMWAIALASRPESWVGDAGGDDREIRSHLFEPQHLGLGRLGQQAVVQRPESQ